MRAAAWAFVLFTLLGVVGVFVPAVGLRVEGTVLAKKASLSLFAASNDRELVRRFVAGYGKSSGRRYGAALIGVLAPRVHGHTKSNLDDAHDAMETLDTVQDADIVTGARAFKIGLWAFLGLQALMSLLILVPLLNNGAVRTRTLVIAFVCSVLVTAMAIGIHFACGEAVFEANDDIGYEILTTAIGALLIPLAAIAGLVSLTVFAVRRRRANRPVERPAVKGAPLLR